jgi:hypothetical protein
MLRALEACKHLAILSAKTLAGSCDRRAPESAGSAEAPLASTSRTAVESVQGVLQNSAVLVRWRKLVSKLMWLIRLRRQWADIGNHLKLYRALK